MKYISLILVVWFLNCAVFKIPFTQKMATPSGYPGVDPKLAEDAVIKSSNYFVSKEEEQESDKYAALGKSELEVSESLWRAIEIHKQRVKADTIKKVEPPKERITEKVTEDADVIIIIEKDTLAPEKQDEVKLEKEKKQEQIDLVEELLTMKMQLYLKNAMENFRIAREKNKFNLDLAIERAEVFQQSYGERLKDPEGFKKSAQELEKVIQFQKGYHQIFDRLGMNYEFLGDWEKALENYKKALFVFDKTASLDVLPDSAKTKEDTLEYQKTRFYYLSNKANAETKLFMADSALVTWYQAFEIAPKYEDLMEVKRKMMDILWDDKNILATVMRDSAGYLMARNEYDSARIVLAKLIPSLKTQKARDEVLTTLALIEFYHLKQKENALNRINNLVKNADADGASPDFYEAPFKIHEFNYYYLDSSQTELIQKNEPNDLFSIFLVNDTSSIKSDNKMTNKTRFRTFAYDSTYKKLYKHIGQIYLDHGIEARKEGRFGDARYYLDLSSRIDWLGRGKAYLGLASASRKDPKESFELCQKAFHFHENLDQNEIQEAFSLMIRLLRSRIIGRIDLARNVHNIRKHGEPIPWNYLIELKL